MQWVDVHWLGLEGLQGEHQEQPCLQARLEGPGDAESCRRGPAWGSGWLGLLAKQQGEQRRLGLWMASVQACWQSGGAGAGAGAGLPEQRVWPEAVDCLAF